MRHTCSPHIRRGSAFAAGRCCANTCMSSPSCSPRTSTGGWLIARTARPRRMRWRRCSRTSAYPKGRHRDVPAARGGELLERKKALALEGDAGGARLVGDAVAGQGPLRGERILARGELHRVKAAARHEKHLILTHAGADRAQLAREAQARAQQPRLGVAASVASVG